MEFKVIAVLGLPTAAICLAASNAPDARHATSNLPDVQVTAKALLEGDLHVPPATAAIAVENAAQAFDWQQTADAWHGVCRSLQARGVAMQQSLKFLAIQSDDTVPASGRDFTRLFNIRDDVDQVLSDLWGGAFLSALRARCTVWSEQGDARDDAVALLARPEK